MLSVNMLGKMIFKVCVSASAGKLAACYATDFPDCHCNTVHTNYLHSSL